MFAPNLIVLQMWRLGSEWEKGGISKYWHRSRSGPRNINSFNKSRCHQKLKIPLISYLSMEISENTLLTEIYLQNFVVSQLHGLVASQDVKVDPAVHTQNRLWCQCCWSVLLLLVRGALDCDDSEEILDENFRIRKRPMYHYSMSRTNQKPITEQPSNSGQYWMVGENSGLIWSRTRKYEDYL